MTALQTVHSNGPLPSPRVSVVIPTLNEAKNLPHVAPRLADDLYEIIIVDGHSTDDTPSVARRLWPHGRHLTQTRQGKGNALACGFAAATGDIIVMIDGDGSTDPAEIPRFVDTLISGAHFAKGSRFVLGGGSSDLTPIRRVGNKVLNRLVNFVHGTNYTDLCYGFNAFWAKHLPVLDLHPGSHDEAASLRWGDGFEVETLINIRVWAAGLTISEVPSFERPRMYGTSNLEPLRDGLRVLQTVFRERKHTGLPLARYRGSTLVADRPTSIVPPRRRWRTGRRHSMKLVNGVVGGGVTPRHGAAGDGELPARRGGEDRAPTASVPAAQ